MKMFSNNDNLAKKVQFSNQLNFREHEGRPVEQGGRVKGCFKKEKLESGTESPTKSLGGNLKNGISDPSKPGLNKKVNCIGTRMKRTTFKNIALYLSYNYFD